MPSCLTAQNWDPEYWSGVCQVNNTSTFPSPFSHKHSLPTWHLDIQRNCTLPYAPSWQPFNIQIFWWYREGYWVRVSREMGSKMENMWPSSGLLNIRVRLTDDLSNLRGKYLYSCEKLTKKHYWLVYFLPSIGSLSVLTRPSRIIILTPVSGKAYREEEKINPQNMFSISEVSDSLVGVPQGWGEAWQRSSC